MLAYSIRNKTHTYLAAVVAALYSIPEKLKTYSLFRNVKGAIMSFEKSSLKFGEKK